jgi:hypothetical protein
LRRGFQNHVRLMLVFLLVGVATNIREGLDSLMGYITNMVGAGSPVGISCLSTM